MEPRAFQDDLAEIGVHQCWGCGAKNESGLRIKSFWSPERPDEALCSWEPGAQFAGWPGVLNGGVLATAIDCHSTCTAVAAAYRAERRSITSDPPIRYATGSLQVSYLRPTPLDQPLMLRARVAERTERKTLVHCSLLFGTDECARAEVVLVRVPSTWDVSAPTRASSHTLASVP